MDSQHRHELQQNDLGKLTNKALPFFERHGWKIVAAVGVVCAATVGGGIWYSISSAKTAEGWTQLDRVMHEQNPSSGDFAGVADKYPGSVVAAWSRLKEADALLKSGLETVFTNRAASEADLKAARDVYEKLVDGGPGVSPDVRERALFGLARTQETMSDGDTEAAAKTYARLTSEFRDSIFAGVARERIAALESPQTKDFYAWFHAQELKPKERQPVNPFHDPADGGDDAEKMPGDDAETPAKVPSGETANDEKEPAAESEKSESTPDSESKTDSGDKPDETPSEESTVPPDDNSKTDSP